MGPLSGLNRVLSFLCNDLLFLNKGKSGRKAGLLFQRAALKATVGRVGDKVAGGGSCNGAVIF